MQDLIFVSMENWDQVWRRNQFLCAGLAQRYPEHKILFVGTPRDFSNQVRRGQLNLHDRTSHQLADFPNITVTRPLKLLPNTVAAGRRINAAMERSHIRREAKRLGMRSPILWLNPHYAVHMVGQLQESAVVYDITDDWTTLTQSESLTRRIIAQDIELCSRADAVIVCSQHLFDLKRERTDNLHLIPNGVDANHYTRVLDSADPLPASAAAWTKPVLGYTGTVHPDRVDVALIEALARGLPEGSIALVGPNMLPASDEARLRRCGNVVLTGAVPYSEIPVYMRAFDVCITPHRVTPFTESLNPIKLWEYLAAGKPIVSTDVAGFRDYPQFVRIARNAKEFLEAIRGAVCEDSKICAARRTEARKHSWDLRLDHIVKVMNDCVNARAPKTVSSKNRASVRSSRSL